MADVNLMEQDELIEFLGCAKKEAHEIEELDKRIVSDETDWTIFFIGSGVFLVSGGIFAAVLIDSLKNRFSFFNILGLIFFGALAILFAVLMISSLIKTESPRTIRRLKKQLAAKKSGTEYLIDLPWECYSEKCIGLMIKYLSGGARPAKNFKECSERALADIEKDRRIAAAKRARADAEWSREVARRRAERSENLKNLADAFVEGVSAGQDAYREAKEKEEQRLIKEKLEELERRRR